MSEVIKNLKDLKDAFIERAYQSKILDHHFERAMSLDRKIMLENKEKPSTQRNLPLVLTFNKTLSDIKNVIDKHWHILSINENLRKVFDKRQFIAYGRNTNLHQLIGGNRIFKNKVLLKNTKHAKQSGHSSPCLSRINNLCSKQVKQTKTFQSFRTKETFQIFHNLTCKSENQIYSNAVYANFSTLEKVRLLSTSASKIIGKMLNHKRQF